MTLSNLTLNIVPLGGLGEIGLNCLALEWAGQILVIDAGLMFPETSQLGVDIVIPDFSYLIERADQVLGIVLTHGHEDHIGSVAYLAQTVKAPIYGTRLTLALAKERLDEAQAEDYELIEIKAKSQLTLGPFEIEFISVSHSIVDGVALAVTTPVGVLIHTGDFKLDLSAPPENRLDLYKFAQYGEKGVLILLSDSTNAEVPGLTTSEKEVGEALTSIFQNAPGRVILACFASSVARLREVARAARAAGRKLLFDGRSMIGIVQKAQELGYLTLGPNETVDLQAANNLADQEIAVVATGSQGEPLSALRRMAMGEHRYIQVRKNDTVVFSARVIPGNERAIGDLVNLFHGLGANVVDRHLNKVHASGHGQVEELKLMLSLTRPKFFVPIHGEYRQLARHAALAKEQGVAESDIFVLTNGQKLTLNERGQAILAEPVQTGRWLVDGSRLASPSDPALKNRIRLAEIGMAIVVLALNVDQLQPVLLAPPLIELINLIYENEPDLTLEATEATNLAFLAFSRDRDPGPLTEEEKKNLTESVRRELRRRFKKAINRKPLFLVRLIEVKTTTCIDEDYLKDMIDTI
ncbi:MAG: ribonuclease J [Deltaproteobacteria bacterium]|nr:ribonuclease J [Deltaproteobacteria bacterium]